MRTVAQLRRRQLRRWTKRCREAYETEQPLADSNSWMRVNCNRSRSATGRSGRPMGTNLHSVGASGLPWPGTADGNQLTQLILSGCRPIVAHSQPCAEEMYLPHGVFWTAPCLR